jgi:ubiquinone/menaquinone biosynthesis C-methylase UbiE
MASMGLWGRVYAAGYDWLVTRMDRRGGEAHRRRLVADATGEVLEIGAGTGKNLPHYRAATRVVALEPEPGMRARAVEAARHASVPVEVAEGDATRLTYADEAFDTVVASLVLCTVPDPGLALAEARRVLRPGGTLRFYEHVRAEDPALARWQDRLGRPWSWIGRGCRANQDTVALIETAGFKVGELDRFSFKPAPPLTRPHVIGVAARH